MDALFITLGVVAMGNGLPLTNHLMVFSHKQIFHSITRPKTPLCIKKIINRVIQFIVKNHCSFIREMSKANGHIVVPETVPAMLKTYVKGQIQIV